MSSKLKIDTRVRSLKGYLEDFEQGKIFIPSFQRDFVWEQDNIKQLFDSIKNNYPIGSIQFWKPNENAESWIGDKPISIGPYSIKRTNVQNEIVYVLDGFQRLSSLFGCLTNPMKYNKEKLELNQDKWNEKYSLYYDLEEEKFMYLRDKSINEIFQIPVYVFMNTLDFRQYQRKHLDDKINEEKIELYLDRADVLGRTLNDYQIAAVDISYATIEEAVEIFWRVNATGLPISKDWIANALTLSDDFRLGDEIDNLILELKPYSFNNIKRDIIFQCIQNSFGKIYFDFKIEELVKRKDFANIAIKSIESIKKSVKFLYENLLVFNHKILPYNSQLIFLTAFFNKLKNTEPTEIQILELKKWFWVTSYSNYFSIYSLSNQRKAFEQFNLFVNNEKVSPIFNDKVNLKFSTLNFPEKTFMGSVRSKALTLFMINYALGIKEISLQKINADSVEEFEIGNLYSIPQKENPTENFVPVVYKRVEIEGRITIESITNTKKPKNYSFLLNEVNENLFISENMCKLEIGNDIPISTILQIRKELIKKAEKLFVESLDIEYT